jgi:hypothetical protein
VTPSFSPPEALEHTVLRWRNRPVFALPKTRPALQHRLLRQFRQLTWKRSLFRAAASALVTTRTTSFLGSCRLSSEPTLCGFDFPGWAAHVAGHLGVDDFQTFVVWPSQPERNRVYVHFLSNAGVLLGFGKLSLHPDANSGIRTESVFLERMTKAKPRAFRVPDVLANGIWEECQFLICEPIPENAKCASHSLNAYPKASVDEFSGPSQFMPRSQIVTTNWWQNFRRTFAESRVADDACEAVDSGCEGCQVHGDMGPGNILITSGDPWIIDWENASESGPVLVDQIGFYLAVNQKCILRSPGEELASIMKRFAPTAGQIKNTLVALVYLHGHGIPSATSLLNKWK